MCSEHDLEQLPIYCATPGCTRLHVGHWLHGVVQSDELCNPHACSTLSLEVNEYIDMYCLHGTDDDQNPQPFGCNATLCEQARQNTLYGSPCEQLHRRSGRRDIQQHEFRCQPAGGRTRVPVVPPGRHPDRQPVISCAQQSVGGSSCAADCAAVVLDYVDNRLEECRQVMLDIGYEPATLRTIDHVFIHDMWWQLVCGHSASGLVPGSLHFQCLRAHRCAASRRDLRGVVRPWF